MQLFCFCGVISMLAGVVLRTMLSSYANCRALRNCLPKNKSNCRDLRSSQRSEKLSTVAICCFYFALKDSVNVQRQYGTANNYAHLLCCLVLKNYLRKASLSTVQIFWLMRLGITLCGFLSGGRIWNT